MKTLLLSLILLCHTTIFSQPIPKKITIDATAFQKVTWPSNMSMTEANNKNLTNYPYHILGHNIYTLNIVNEKLTIKTPESEGDTKILTYHKTKTDHFFEMQGEFDTPFKIAITQKDNGEYIFILQMSRLLTNDTSEAYFTETRDMTITYEY